MTSLFEPFPLGPITLSNRVVMAPMTRARALGQHPDTLTTQYYQQRSSAGLIISEGAPVSPEGRGQAFTPGIYAPRQLDGWRQVTDAVHADGGHIYAQLWHVGRNSHVSHQPGGGAPVSSVAVAAQGMTFAFDEDGQAKPLPTSTPRALETDEVARVTGDFVAAARNARAAGFDGVEIHGANGYLFEQFINGALNTRDDRYGGSIANRLRFALETVDAVVAAVGSDRVGIRLAPFGRFGDMHAFDDEEATWLALAAELSSRKLAYVHVSDQASIGADAIPDGFVDKFRAAYSGTLMLAGGFDRDKGQAALDAGRADLIAIGQPFIANPDLVARMRHGWPIATPQRETYYGGDARGYVDYPVHDPERVAA